MRSEPSIRSAARSTSVEPSRAWILGLVVAADGTLLAPPPADPEWPVTDHPATRAGADQITSADVSSARP